MVDVQIWPMVTTTVAVGGQPVTAAYGPMLGGYIQNPMSSADQGTAVPETLYVNLEGSATLIETRSNFKVEPGQAFRIPDGFTGRVSVNAPSSNHRFSGIVFHEATNFRPSTSVWPPDGPTTLLNTIPSYLYQQYTDDDDLQAFVASYNDFAQAYVTWFAYVNLPDYTGDPISGDLLDWVAEGLYGIRRPVLPSGFNRNVGPLNTYAFNGLALNAGRIIAPESYYITTDDIFKRIITWHFFKGDGKVFDIRWLKRRVKRFLTGTNGTWGETDQTYDVSVTFGVGHQVNINLQSTRRFSTGGAILNVGVYNKFVPNVADTSAVIVPISPYVPIFKAAVEAGVLELPFQFDYVVNVN